MDGQTERTVERQSDRQKDRHRDRENDRQTDRETDGRTNGRTDRQTYRQTDEVQFNGLKIKRYFSDYMDQLNVIRIPVIKHEIKAKHVLAFLRQTLETVK
ncbi:hypothetical protein DPMN_113695 [Dreissena polymorpha]|uniref:Uncharacterized protein n=1 Tax=Dreissena polymorpha TaxID=45954 RepID=A0A9D4KHY7_DREPO|nr:hypothetical protein DPMN_113695 [Dreissena polymorpha]